jgi:hypothetical protein
MTRTGMSDIFAELRQMTEAGTADYTLGTVTYWSDLQLQNILDRHAFEVDGMPMQVFPHRIAGGFEYKEYYIGHKWIEQEAAGTSIFKITDVNGATIGTALYSVDYNVGEVEFVADQGTAIQYMVTCVSYDIESAAAKVWRKKASHYSAAYDFSTDNHSVKRSQLYDHAKERAEYYDGRGGEGVSVTSLGRADDTC